MEHQKKRLSILKVRQPLETLDETNALGQGAPGESVTTTTRDRRVSFHNVKHVRQYHRDHGNLIDASPLREKITDTMDSDGILTPRGRNLDASETGENATINVFGKQNGTMDMSLETENGGNDTMKMFEVTTHEKTITTVTERIVERHVVGIPKQNTAADDTMVLFNTTNNEEKEMTIDESAIFAVPRLPNPNATSNQTVRMDLDESQVPQSNETMNMFNVSTASVHEMDISNAQNSTNAPKLEDVDMELTQVEQPEEATSRVMNQSTMNQSMDISIAPGAAVGGVNETLAMFQSPARGALINESMDISMAPEQKSPAREVVAPAREVLAPTANNETLALFQSPASVRRNEHSTMILERTQRVFEDDPNDVEMEITQVEQPEESPRAINQSIMNQSMDISVAPAVNETLKMFESPARNRTIPIELFNESVEMNEETAIPIDDSVPMVEQVSEQSPLVAEEERAQVQSSMMMDISSVRESLVDQSMQKSSQETEETLTEKSVQETLEESMQASSPQQKTMQIEKDATITPMPEVFEETMENQKTFQENTFTKDISITMNSSSIRNTTLPMSNRRRSLIRECSSRAAVLESPRRVALENSMISMNVGNMTALVEHRRRKSIQMNQSQKELTNLNESIANMSAGRDIFALNTSIRSPKPMGTPSDNVSLIHIAPESPPSFQMPNFDRAVTNIVWLTPDEHEDVAPPEAAEFARLIAMEKLKAEEEVRMTLLDRKLDPKKVVSGGKVSSKLSNDEKEVVLIAREEAEIRFLELRREFAAQTRRKYEEQVQCLETENARMAEQLRDVEQMEALKEEIEELRNRPTHADYERTRAEWKTAKREAFEMQMEALRAAQETLIALREERLSLLIDIEERQERLAQAEEREEQEKTEMKAILEGLMSGI